MINALWNRIDSYRALRVRHTSSYWQAMADIPPSLQSYWKNTAHFEFEGIPRDAFFFARAAEGLCYFFDCASRSSEPCGLPSRAVDSVWHAWLRFNPEGLKRFCMRHFGREIEHVEAVHMASGMGAALGVCMVKAREIEGKPVAGPSVPKLFELDAALRMPHGTCYLRHGTALYRQRLDEKGRRNGALMLDTGLSASGLLAAGLISQVDHDAYVRRYETSCGAVDLGASLESACEGGGDSSGDGGGCGGCGGGCGS